MNMRTFAIAMVFLTLGIGATGWVTMKTMGDSVVPHVASADDVLVVTEERLELLENAEEKLGIDSTCPEADEECRLTAIVASIGELDSISREEYFSWAEELFSNFVTEEELRAILAEQDDGRTGVQIPTYNWEVSPGIGIVYDGRPGVKWDNVSGKPFVEWDKNLDGVAERWYGGDGSRLAYYFALKDGEVENVVVWCEPGYATHDNVHWPSDGPPNPNYPDTLDEATCERVLQIPSPTPPPGPTSTAAPGPQPTPLPAEWATLNVAFFCKERKALVSAYWRGGSAWLYVNDREIALVNDGHLEWYDVVEDTTFELRIRYNASGTWERRFERAELSDCAPILLTATPGPTMTTRPSDTPVFTPTPVFTATPIPTSTTGPSQTPQTTATASATATHALPPTPTATGTFGPGPSVTPVNTPVFTSTPISTSTPTPTRIVGPSPTPTCDNFPPKHLDASTGWAPSDEGRLTIEIASGDVGIAAGYQLLNNGAEFVGGGCRMLVLLPGVHHLQCRECFVHIYTVSECDREGWIKNALIPQEIETQVVKHGCPLTAYSSTGSRDNPDLVRTRQGEAGFPIPPVSRITVENPLCLREATGKGNSLRFGSGAIVVGYKITLDMYPGREFYQCTVEGAPSPGTVTDGVICPDRGERLTACILP